MHVKPFEGGPKSEGEAAYSLIHYEVLYDTTARATQSAIESSSRYLSTCREALGFHRFSTLYSALCLCTDLFLYRCTVQTVRHVCGKQSQFMKYNSVRARFKVFCNVQTEQKHNYNEGATLL